MVDGNAVVVEIDQTPSRIARARAALTRYAKTAQRVLLAEPKTKEIEAGL